MYEVQIMIKGKSASVLIVFLRTIVLTTKCKLKIPLKYYSGYICYECNKRN